MSEKPNKVFPQRLKQLRLIPFKTKRVPIKVLRQPHIGDTCGIVPGLNKPEICPERGPAL